MGIVLSSTLLSMPIKQMKRPILWHEDGGVVALANAEAAQPSFLDSNRDNCVALPLHWPVP